VKALTVKRGREASLLRRHPWLFSGAIASRQGEEDGLAEVRDAGGRVLARGLSCSGSQIEARLWTFGEEEFTPELVRARFERALALRRRVVPPQTTGYRLLHSEGDQCPGLVADRYGSSDVLILTAEGAEAREDELVSIYRGVFSPAKLIVRREDEAPEDHEQMAGEGPVAFLENGLRFLADVGGGQKTGFFLDQRDNRERIRRLSAERTVLDLFCYSGAFSVAALAGRARRAVAVDSSPAALELARIHRGENGFGAAADDFVEASVFEDLRRRAAGREQWDIVICDPPAFARKKGDVDRAARGYKDIVRLAMGVTAPGGILLACSCSGLVSAELFQKILFAAALDSKTSFSIFAKSGAGADHPVSLYCPESEYLKAFFLRRGE
jgi:23S rRNA (cytosine1962-C5)-methyltransferase